MTKQLRLWQFVALVALVTVCTISGVTEVEGVKVSRRGGWSWSPPPRASPPPPPAPRWSPPPPAPVWRPAPVHHHAPAPVWRPAPVHHHVWRPAPVHHHAPRHHHVAHVHHAPRHHHVAHHHGGHHHHRHHHVAHHHGHRHHGHHHHHRVHHHRGHHHHHHRHHHVRHHHGHHHHRHHHGRHHHRHHVHHWGRHHHRHHHRGHRHHVVHKHRHHGHRHHRHHHHKVHHHKRHHHKVHHHKRHHHKVHHHKRHHKRHHHKRHHHKKHKVHRKRKDKKKKRSPSDYVGFVNGLYNQYLCRDGEPGGMAGWTGALASGAMTESQVIDGFLNSAEYRGRGGKPCPRKGNWEAYVRGLYHSLLCREGEPAGVAGWVGALTSGALNEAQVRDGFLNSPEYRGRGGRPCGGAPAIPAHVAAIVAAAPVHHEAAPAPVHHEAAPAPVHHDAPPAPPAPAPFVPAPPAPVPAPIIVKEWVPDPTPNAPWRAPPAVQVNYPNILTDRSATKAQLTCPEGQRIRVLDASYGAGQGIWTASGFINKGACHAESSFSKVYLTCSRKQTCSVAASTAIFGEPCQGTDKELLVTYQCAAAPKRAAPKPGQPAPPPHVEEPLPPPVPPTPVQTLYDGIFMTQKRSGKTAVLTCPAGQVIDVLDATYGSHPGLYSSNGYIKRGTCHASASTSVVSTACQGKGECRVSSNDATFPDSGCTEARKLKVTWRCDPKPVPFRARTAPKPRKFRKVKKAAPVVAAPARAEEVVNIAPPVGDANQVHVHVNVAAPKSKSSNAGLQAMVDRVAAKNQAAAAKMDEILAKLKSQNCKGPDCLPDTKELEDWKADWVLEAQETAEIVP